MPEIRYVKYPDAKVFDEEGNQTDHLLFGDWVRDEGPAGAGAGMKRVHARGRDGLMRDADLQPDRVLEIVLVDVGQGDGALIITPDDRHLLVDAGQFDNMYRFLRWRYRGFRSAWTFDAAVITHPDQDHYKGFSNLFADPNVFFGHVFHNGIIETNESSRPLGAMSPNQPRRLVELMESQTDLESFLAQTDRWRSNGSQKQYPKLLQAALGRVAGGGGNRVRMLSVDPAHNDGAGFMPGFGAGSDVKIRVLGPVVERVNGQARLRVFGDTVASSGFNAGKTKNGHSVILMVEYGGTRILLGGDLNAPAETHLLRHYTGTTLAPASADEEAQILAAARAVFRADVVKCCHHGSGDFTDLFMAATHPAATIVSSGDEESHAHPRCDTLGAIGLHGRGWRPLILSTELMRSHREDEGDAREQLGRLDAQIEAETDAGERAELIEARDSLIERITRRNVTVYGAINVRTDGDRMVLAYKLEKVRTGSAGGRKTWTEWDIYRLERGAGGELAFVPPNGNGH